MTTEEIKELIQVVNESGIAELEVQRGENRVRIRRSHNTPPPQEIVMAAPAAAQTVITSAASPQGSQSPANFLQAAIQAPERASNETLVKSPIVGTYYDAPSPGAPTFVAVGDRVKPGQVLCIIESMKLMNEIESEMAGVITAKLVENGRPVEYGEALFSVRPS
ncbi:MAG TPA: acetyl-CoA carboxylase biotin carboxyl carrier protein [Bryobacteraceae bacterium]|nr:acetyl-CoA carboxylase biotin carboxyl carrier protein [Bryobacteraceae bacterium]